MFGEVFIGAELDVAADGVKVWETLDEEDVDRQVDVFDGRH